MAIQSTTGAGAPSVRARSRTNPTGSRAPANPGATADWMSSGAAAIEGHQQHQEHVAQRREERQAEVGVPWRHFLAKGEEVDAIILDNDFGPGLFEHDLTMNDRFKRMNPRTGRPFDQFVTSPRQWETDPLEQEGFNPYYATFLTVAILRPYTDGQGRQRSYQRRLVALKGEAMEMMTMIRAQQIKAGHADAPLRGVHIVFKRGNGDQSLKTGLPMFIERHSEAEIMETFGHPAVTAEQGARAGQIVKQANEDCYPIDYARAFPKPSADAIRARFNLGTNTVAGSGGYNRGHFNDSGSNEPDGGGGYDGDDNDDNGGGASTNGFANAGAGGGNGFADDLDDDVPF